METTDEGGVSLPDEVNILRFAAARSKEIAAMTECIENPRRTKLVFQSLPVHMRRRVMSHNPRRLPRRLRAAHSHQVLKSRGGDSSAKGPAAKASRRHRRRPRNLLSEFARRQRGRRWLETHVWHAKRFRTVERWGHRLPEAPCDKAFRACYRAGSAHCLLQDISYFSCVQISGRLDELAAGFRRVTSSSCGLGVAARAFASGQREGSAVVFGADSYPRGCIGPVSFVWKPPREGDDPIKYVWIFSHAAYYEQILRAFKDCFELKESAVGVGENEYVNNNMSLAMLKKGRRGRRIVPKSNLKSFSNDRRTITLIELKDSVNRFRLTGPLSHAILVESLKTATVSNDKVDHEDWFTTSMRDATFKSIHDTQTNFWQTLKGIASPSEVQSHLVIGLTVDDPRLYLPSKRTKAKWSGNPSPENLIEIPENLCRSSLWDLSIRNSVCENKVSSHTLNERRETENLVPGEGLRDTSDIPKIPIVLIQRPGSKDHSLKKLGFGCGWDVILPAGYAMPFWLSFVLRGARTGGLRESSKLNFESGIHEMHPDTEAGRIEDDRIAIDLRKKYFRLPPNKRVNFNKLSISSPFKCAWSVLSNEWTKEKKEENGQPFVIRDVNMLKSLQNMIATRRVSSDMDWNQKCLVPVSLSAMGKGKITDFALICLPIAGDDASKPCSTFAEPLKNDKNESKRKKLRLAHKTLLKCLRRKAVKKRKSILKAAKKYVAVPKQDNSAVIDDYLKQMQELWLPTKVESVRHQCSRETIGYVTKGEYSFTEAKCLGLGYIALSSLPQLINASRNCLVLTRNTLSRQYRFAKLQISCNLGI